MTERVLALELFCGIGGAAIALQKLSAKIQLAVDIYPLAIQVYQQHFRDHATRVAELASFDTSQSDANFWWLSPPCLPFTRRGQQRDLQDSRTQALVALIQQVSLTKPQAIAIENVPPFATSDTAAWIRKELEQCGYHTAIELRCPTELGWPMRRPRCYLLASRFPMACLPSSSQVPELKPADSRLAAFLDPEPASDLQVPVVLINRYASAIDVVDEDSPNGCTACFTSAYGRSPVQSGSYLRNANGGLRYFSPQEIARLMGFPSTFELSACPSYRQRWDLIGNSLSVPVVAWVMSRLIQSNGHFVSA